MEISLVSPEVIKVKGKHASLYVYKSLGELAYLTKSVETDGVIALDGLCKENEIPVVEKLKDVRVIISGPGGFEVGGIKISGTKLKNGAIVYILSVDGMDILIAKSDFLEGLDKKKEVHMAVLYTNSTVPENFVTDISPKYVVLYGPEAAKQESITTKTTKLAASSDKLPVEMERVVLA